VLPGFEVAVESLFEEWKPPSWRRIAAILRDRESALRT
jgi:hypothetical protein